MEKWYLSENGNVNGPFGVKDVQSLVSKNSDLYGWNPSLSYWLPVTKIQEFQEFLPADQSSSQVSKELIDKFVNKKRDLIKKTTLIDQSIQQTTKTLTLYENEINQYKELTKALSPEVQDNIEPLEKKYNAINKQLTDLKRAAEISKQEIDDVVREFGDLILNKATENIEDIDELTPVNTKNEEGRSVSLNEVDVDEPIPSVEPTKNVAENNTDDSVITSSTNFVPQSNNKSNDLTSKSTEHPFDQSAVEAGKADTERKVEPAPKKGFTNKLKSVFSQHNTNEDVPDKLSDQLLKLEKEVIEEVEDDEEVVFIDSELSPDALVQADSTKVAEESEVVDSEPKKKRRRRRRF